MRRILAAALLAALLAAPSPAGAAKRGRYHAEIRRTTGGMAHVKARDYGSLGFGAAYAYAEDQACRFADIMLTVKAQRTRYFGPEASYGDLGGQTNNLRSDFFYEQRGDERLPMSGCPDDEGCFNTLTSRRDDRGAYVPYTGSSFVMAAELTGKGPRGRAILRYSQSEKPRSPYYADQTRLYAQERWLPLRYTERQIRADAGYAHERVTGRR